MNEFLEIKNYFSNFTLETIIDVIISIGIIIFSFIISSGVAYLITKIIKKQKKVKNIKKEGLYITLKIRNIHSNIIFAQTTINK